LQVLQFCMQSVRSIEIFDSLKKYRYQSIGNSGIGIDILLLVSPTPTLYTEIVHIKKMSFDSSEISAPKLSERIQPPDSQEDVSLTGEYIV